jgi:hypothetical protein
MDELRKVEVGDTVRVSQTDGNRSYKGKVRDVREYDTEDDDAVYVEFVHEECPTGDDGFIAFKKGFWKGEEYSWLRKAPTNTTNSKEIATDCCSLTIC